MPSCVLLYCGTTVGKARLSCVPYTSILDFPIPLLGLHVKQITGNCYASINTVLGDSHQEVGRYRYKPVG